MGGGASAMQEMEEILTCAYLLGRSIVAISFPDMYSIRDFHSPDAPPLKNAQASFSPDNPFGLELEQEHNHEDTDEDDEEEEAFDYSGRFVVIVGDDKVVIDDVTVANEDGWTPLHSCCHSHTTVSAGLAILEEMSYRNASLEVKTKRGPSAHNSGWTALHMASAYGVEPLVVQLLAHRANANCRNSLQWSPLHEACHRGFITIVKELLSHGASMSFVPDREAASNHPFSRPPPQSPLGEAARCGFTDICRILLDRGADKDQRNDVGWTPLHEAAFYNYVDVVRLLLVYGADAAAKNRQGATPYQLASLPPVKEAIEELGGEDALRGTRDQDAAGGAHLALEGPGPSEPAARPSPTTPNTRSAPKPSRGSPGDGGAKDELLHSGRLLGDLPSLTPPHQPANALRNSFDEGRPQFREQGGARPAQSSPIANVNPRDVPREFLCNITKKPLGDPVATPYGHVYERSVILQWIDRNGSIDPMTGQPLSKSELKPDQDLLRRMEKWSLERSFHQTSLASSPVGNSQAVGQGVSGGALPNSPSSSIPEAKASAGRVEHEDEGDLYDF